MIKEYVCPCCGQLKIAGFLKWLETYPEYVKAVTCSQCHGNVEILSKNISYQSYKIEMCTSSNETKYYTVKTYNEPDSVIIVVGV